MSKYDDFLEENGPAIGCRPATAEAISKYSKKLPPALIDFWKESGWCGYADGLIWFDDPGEYTDVLEDWDVPKGSLVIGHTGFGNLFLWAEKQVQYLFVHHARLGPMTDDFDIFMNGMLASPRYVSAGLLGKQYKQVVKRLGVPAADECFTFVPALALGGAEDFKAMQKVKLREQLGILAEIVNS